MTNLTDDERRVMEYFAKVGGRWPMEEIVDGIERGFFLMDPDVHYDEADVRQQWGLVHLGDLRQGGALATCGRI